MYFPYSKKKSYSLAISRCQKTNIYCNTLLPRLSYPAQLEYKMTVGGFLGKHNTVVPRELSCFLPLDSKLHEDSLCLLCLLVHIQRWSWSDWPRVNCKVREIFTGESRLCIAQTWSSPLTSLDLRHEKKMRVQLDIAWSSLQLWHL